MEEFAIFVKFVNFGCHNNYFRPGPRLLYATCSFKVSCRGLVLRLSPSSLYPNQAALEGGEDCVDTSRVCSVSSVVAGVL